MVRLFSEPLNIVRNGGWVVRGMDLLDRFLVLLDHRCSRAAAVWVGKWLVKLDLIGVFVNHRGGVISWVPSLRPGRLSVVLLIVLRLALLLSLIGTLISHIDSFLLVSGTLVALGVLRWVVTKLTKIFLSLLGITSLLDFILDFFSELRSLLLGLLSDFLGFLRVLLGELLALFSKLFGFSATLFRLEILILVTVVDVTGSGISLEYLRGRSLSAHGLLLAYSIILNWLDLVGNKVWVLVIVMVAVVLIVLRVLLVVVVSLNLVITLFIESTALLDPLLVLLLGHLVVGTDAVKLLLLNASVVLTKLVFVLVGLPLSLAPLFLDSVHSLLSFISLLFESSKAILGLLGSDLKLLGPLLCLFGFLLGEVGPSIELFGLLLGLEAKTFSLVSHMLDLVIEARVMLIVVTFIRVDRIEIMDELLVDLGKILDVLLLLHLSVLLTLLVLFDVTSLFTLFLGRVTVIMVLLMMHLVLLVHFVTMMMIRFRVTVARVELEGA